MRLEIESRYLQYYKNFVLRAHRVPSRPPSIPQEDGAGEGWLGACGCTPRHRSCCLLGAGV